MNSLQTANHVINLIVRQSKDKLQENKVIKSKLTPYSASSMLNTKTDLVLQSGAKNEISNTKNLKQQINCQDKPQTNLKDTYSFFSVKKCKQQIKQNAQESIPKEQCAKKINNFFNRKKNTNQFSKEENLSRNQTDNKKISVSNKQSAQSVCIQIQEKPQVIPAFLKRQQGFIQHLRQIKHIQFQERQSEMQKQQNQSQISTERQNKLTSYLQNHISRQNNSHTYDIQGSLLLFSHENNRKALSRVYPTVVRYNIESEQDKNASKRNINYRAKKKSNSETENYKRPMSFSNHNIRGAKGQIFKSSVLKTINLSRISIGGTNAQDDPINFMRRNDLFNNNHCRQTTSIPFIKVQGGSMLKETSTNQCISNKDFQTEAQSRNGENSQAFIGNSRAKSHDCRSRSEFKKYSVARQGQVGSNSFIQKAHENVHGKMSKIHPMSSKASKNTHSIGDTRYSSFYLKRPHTTEVGRIKRQNSGLFNSMLQF